MVERTGERGIGFGFVLGRDYRGSSRGVRVGKWETWVWFSSFPSALRRRCGNVGNSRCRRVFQGAVGRVENLRSVFQAFHGPGISTVLSLVAPDVAPRAQNRGGKGDSILQSRRSFSLARFMRLADSVSLMAWAIWSSCSKLRPGLRYCSALGNDFSLS